MTPEQTRLLAEHACAAIAAAAGVTVETVRTARDDATAPHAEIPAAALRRVWLWALEAVAPSRSAAAIAAGVSRPTIRRAVEAVDAWCQRDQVLADLAAGAGHLTEGLACLLTSETPLISAAGAQALKDQADVRRARAARPKARPKNKSLQDIAARERAAGNIERANYIAKLAAAGPRSEPLRARDLHRVRPAASAL